MCECALRPLAGVFRSGVQPNRTHGSRREEGRHAARAAASMPDRGAYVYARCWLPAAAHCVCLCRRDVLFCHRPDPDTPIEETVRAMNWVIDQVGISSMPL